jgi:hypothetical protein
MAYATVSDVSTRLGRPISDPAEIAQVEAWIGDVEGMILDRIPDLAVYIAEGRPTLATVAAVVANAVIRKVRNPDGKVQEGVDDYNYRLNENARRGELFLTDEEWALLAPVGGVGAFTIRPYGAFAYSRGEWVHPDVWVPLP